METSLVVLAILGDADFAKTVIGADYHSGLCRDPVPVWVVLGYLIVPPPAQTGDQASPQSYPKTNLNGQLLLPSPQSSQEQPI
jgi:hypothetical protein